MLRALRRPRHRRHRHPPADPPTSATPARCPARSARPTRPTLRAAAPPPSPAPTASTSSPQVTTPEPYTVGRRTAPFRDRRLRLRHQAHDPAPPRRGSARSRSCPASTPAADVLAREPDGVFLSNGPGDPATVPYAVEAIARPARRGAGVRHLPRPPAARPRRSAASTVKLPFGHHGGNHPVQQPRHRARSRSPARTTTSPSTADSLAGGADDDPRQPQRRRVRGPRVTRRAGVQRAAPPRGRARARTTRATCSTEFAELIDAPRRTRGTEVR